MLDGTACPISRDVVNCLPELSRHRNTQMHGSDTFGCVLCLVHLGRQLQHYFKSQAFAYIYIYIIHYIYIYIYT